MADSCHLECKEGRENTAKIHGIRFSTPNVNSYSVLGLCCLILRVDPIPVETETTAPFTAAINLNFLNYVWSTFL